MTGRIHMAASGGIATAENVPWTMGCQPSYRTEARLWVRFGKVLGGA